MRPAYYQNKLEALRERAGKKELRHLARQIALSFLDRYFYNDQHEEEYVRLLCEMATCFDDDELNRIGAAALFGIVIEGLCDDFEELQTETYNRVMCHVVSICRNMPMGAELDRQLKDFGLNSYDDLFSRIEKLRNNSDQYRKDMEPPQKILLLSRVTIGADVAINSVMIQRLTNMFPDAEIIVIGNSKLEKIYGGNPDIRIEIVDYSRHGGMFERFSVCHAVLEVINREFASNKQENMILVDPDSRLSQLGVLPLIKDENYLFFNSRGKDSYPKKVSISELANHWLDMVFGESEFCYPRVWLHNKALDLATRFTEELRAAGCQNIIAINLGVGGNSRKRLSEDFEKKLLLKLLEEPKTVIILDKGFGEEEVERTNRLLGVFDKSVYPAIDTFFEAMVGNRLSRGIVSVESDIGQIAALISKCDEFIGYDSACQHIAASLGIPTYTIFAGSNNTRFIRRWHACGPTKSEIIHVDTLTHPPMFDTEDIVSRIIDARAE